MDYIPDFGGHAGGMWCLGGDHQRLSERLLEGRREHRDIVRLDQEDRRIGFCASKVYKMTPRYHGDSRRIEADHETRSAIADVLQNLGRFMDKDRIVRIEEFVDPDDGASSVWLRVICSLEETTTTHDAIDRFYSEWWWARMENAPVGILVGVGS